MFENLNPLDRSTAIMEILIMLLVAFIIGFIIGWLLKQNKKQVVTQSATGNNDELNALRKKLQQSESDYKNLKTNLGKVQTDLDDCRASRRADMENSIPAPVVSEPSPVSVATSVSSEDQSNAERLGFEAASADDKDDLTRISGVGPFIEKKLNALGIYTFKQISGFTTDTIERVTKAIEFFPGRIQRDNWVSQASDLHKQKNNS